MKLLDTLRQRAIKKDATIVLPEANLDKRVLEAGEIILKEGLSKLIVFGKVEEYTDIFKKSQDCTIIDISKYDRLEELAQALYELRKHKGLTVEQARDMIKSPDYFAMMLLKANIADGVVAGAKWSTGDTLRPALQIVKTKPDKKIVTGTMLMVKEGCEPLLFSDIKNSSNML